MWVAMIAEAESEEGRLGAYHSRMPIPLIATKSYYCPPLDHIFTTCWDLHRAWSCSPPNCVLLNTVGILNEVRGG